MGCSKAQVDIMTYELQVVMARADARDRDDNLRVFIDAIPEERIRRTLQFYSLVNIAAAWPGGSSVICQ
jgi:hypothetical protein